MSWFRDKFSEKDDAFNKRYEQKKKAKKAKYEKWLDSLKGEDKKAALEIDAALKGYEAMEDKLHFAKVELETKKEQIIALFEAHHEQLLKKHQHLVFGNYKLGYVNRSKVETSEDFELAKFIEVFGESAIRFDLSSTMVKQVINMPIMQGELEAVGVSLEVNKKFYVEYDSGF